MFVCGHDLFLEAHSKSVAASFEEQIMPRHKISEHIFALNGGYCVYYPSNIFQSPDAFRPITRERKCLMDYNNISDISDIL